MLKKLSSARITVVCLFLLFILTFWGTIAQVQQGLYSAQDRFFNSFFFLAAGFIPFPGAQLILWILFINLISMIIVDFAKFLRWNNIGNTIIHFGLILYFVAAFMVFQLSRESNVHISEGQATNVSTSYNEWELAYWKSDSTEHQVTAFNTKYFKPNFQIPFKNNDFTLKVKQFYPNSDAFNDSGNKKNPKILNVSGISLLTPKAILKEKEQNIAGGVFELKFNNKSYTLVLFGAEAHPTPVPIAGHNYYFILRHKRYPLPFTIKLDKFKAEFYAGTNMAKNYESNVTISTGSLERQARIYMNNPLVYKDYALYQASYDVDSTGKQYSTLAVVKNAARILPYIACLLVFLGLALHFLIQAFSSRNKL